MLPELSIIIVNWNAREVLPRCMSSIADNPPSVPHEIIVVDNASTDGSLAWLREQSSLTLEVPIRLIENRHNAGFGRACNQAIFSSQSRFVFLLNPDAEVQSGAIDVLVNCMKSDDRIGACGPQILNADGTVQTSAWSSSVPFALNIILDGLGIYRVLPARLRGRLLLGRHWDYSERRRCNSLSGAAIMVRRGVIDAVGAFDEQFEMYGEDIEWCWRMDRAGWLLLVEPAAKVVHDGGHSALKRWSSTERALKQEEATLRFQRHCLTRVQFTMNTLSSVFVLTVLRLRATLLRRAPSVEYLDAVLAIKLGYLRRVWLAGVTATKAQETQKGGTSS